MIVDGETLLTVGEAAVLYNISEQILWREIRKGNLQAYDKLGVRGTLVKPSDVEKLIAPRLRTN